MRAFIFAIVIAASAAPAFAQQPDVAMLQKAIVAIQNQRNQALDAQASSDVRAAMLVEESVKLKARIQQLEDKYEPKTDTPK